jgi:hypothetical protein
MYKYRKNSNPLPPAHLHVDGREKVRAGDQVLTRAGWKPVHHGDAVIGARVGPCQVARPAFATAKNKKRVGA